MGLQAVDPQGLTLPPTPRAWLLDRYAHARALGVYLCVHSRIVHPARDQGLIVPPLMGLVSENTSMIPPAASWAPTRTAWKCSETVAKLGAGTGKAKCWRGVQAVSVFLNVFGNCAVMQRARLPFLSTVVIARAHHRFPEPTP